MDISKEGKEAPQAIDINETMNNLLSKVSEAVSRPEGASVKDLQEISNELSLLREVDKTTPYTLLPETQEKLRKAAQSLQMPESVSKESGEELPSPEKTFKLPADEVPQTQEEAQKRYNEIVNENLDKTIKTIEEVIAASKTSSKNENEIQAVISEQAEKIANQILIGLLGQRLKNFTQLAVAPQEAQKQENDFELNTERAGKDSENQQTIEDTAKTEKSTQVIEAEDPEAAKPVAPDTEQQVGYWTDRVPKQSQGIGSFPDFRAKQQEQTPVMPEFDEKQQQELQAADQAQLKELQDVDYQIDSTEKQTIDPPRPTEADEKDLVESPRADAPDLKSAQDVSSDNQNKTEKEITETDPEDYTENKTEKQLTEKPQPEEGPIKQTEAVDQPEAETNKQSAETPQPEEGSTKSTEEIEAAAEGNQKSAETIDNPSSPQNKSTISSSYTNDLDQPDVVIDDKINETVVENSTSKSINETPLMPAASNKTIVQGSFGLQGEPDIVITDAIESASQSFLLLNPVFDSSAPVTEENAPTIQATGKLDPSRQQLYGIGESPEDGAEKSNESLNPALDGATPTNKGQEPIGAAIGSEDKSSLSLDQATREDEKPPTADSWWEKIGDTSPNSVQQSNTFFGVDLGDSAGWIGDALSFFAISAADITRYANTVRRTLNTEANAQAIMQGQTSGLFGFGGGDSGGLNQIEQARANEQLEEGEYTTRKGSNNRGGLGSPGMPNNMISNQYEGKTLVPEEPGYWTFTDDTGHQAEMATERKPSAASGDEAEEIAGQTDSFIDTATIRQLAERFLQPWAAGASNTNKPIFSGQASSDVENWLSIRAGAGYDSIEGDGYKFENRGYATPGTDDAYTENFRRRTQQIAGVGATGFLKIYTKRALDFAGTQRNNENFIIPFQFEPEISGDSKSADYNQVSTLGRSQSAQVYRKSTERNITMTLNYLVSGPSLDEEYERRAAGESRRSRSAQGMELWTEEYIYTYIVRNLRNLVLPNVTDDTRYRLAPPIVQVWYGGIDASAASSTGYETDADNSRANEIYPTFRTNWHTSDGQQKTFRSLWVTKDVSFEYKAGKVNNKTRNNLWVVASLQLTEIAPSVTANEVFLWNSLTR